MLKRAINCEGERLSVDFRGINVCIMYRLIVDLSFLNLLTNMQVKFTATIASKKKGL